MIGTLDICPDPAVDLFEAPGLARSLPFAFAGGSLSLPLAALRDTGLPGALLFFGKSCPVITVLAALRFCAIAPHILPLSPAHLMIIKMARSGPLI